MYLIRRNCWQTGAVRICNCCAVVLIVADPGTGRTDFSGMSGFDGSPGHPQHSDSSKEDAAFHGLPTSVLVVLEVEGQLGPTVGPFNAGTAVKESHVQGRPSAQDTVGVGG